MKKVFLSLACFGFWSLSSQAFAAETIEQKIDRGVDSTTRFCSLWASSSSSGSSSLEITCDGKGVLRVSGAAGILLNRATAYLMSKGMRVVSCNLATADRGSYLIESCYLARQ